MNISLENVDPAWLLALLAGTQGVGFWWLKKDTRPGSPTISERVDVVVQTLEYAQAQLVVHKKETAERFDDVEVKQNEIRGVIEEVKTGQKQMADSVDKIRESVDRRYKGEHNGES